jgi:hypothetical protein
MNTTKLDSQFPTYAGTHDLNFAPQYRDVQSTDVQLGNGQTSKMWLNRNHQAVASELYDQSGKELGFSVFNPLTGKLKQMIQIDQNGNQTPVHFDTSGAQANGGSGR